MNPCNQIHFRDENKTVSSSGDEGNSRLPHTISKYKIF